MEPLSRDLQAFVADPDPAAFDALAVRLFARQFAGDAPYRRFCVGRGVTPERVRGAEDLPAVPAAAFRRHALTCAPEDACTPERGGRVFHSSGTTGPQTSRHFMDADALSLYRASLRAGFARFVAPPTDPRPILALAPPPEVAPHSSLSFMLDTLIADRGGAFFWPESENDPWVARLAARLEAQEGPAIVFGTAFAWVHVADTRGERRLALPDGSLAVETGGFKGRSRELSRDAFYALLRECLGVSDDACLSEYGMSEMASQFYGRGVAGAKCPPPWLRARAVDPRTGRPAPPGVPGLLAYVDLANVNSVAALQTEDWGSVGEDGAVTLLGRAPGAVLRGCSLLSETIS